jgi:hypothetical protein|tara:strand:+ start:275 stop:508 length:234 start_codon:yes stop_codon:yes gene_type:complete
MKFFVDELWVYFIKDDELHKTELDAVGFFETEKSIRVAMCRESTMEGRIEQLEKLRTLLRSPYKPSQGKVIGSPFGS